MRPTATPTKTTKKTPKHAHDTSTADSGHAEIRGNEEADRLAKEASKGAESMSDENKCISLAEFKQAVKVHRISMCQRRWDVSEKGRFLYGLMPEVNKKQQQFLTFQTESNTVL